MLGAYSTEIAKFPSPEADGAPGEAALKATNAIYSLRHSFNFSYRQVRTNWIRR